MKSILLSVCFSLFSTLTARATTGPNPASDGNNEEVFQREGVVANRASRTVRVEARATGVAPDTKTEFFLIAPNSGHDYEAVAVSKALPSDVHAALEFIGVPVGRPVYRDVLQYWPKGERVFAFIERATGDRFPLEDTILDCKSGKSLPREGFIFTGSLRIPDLSSTNEPARQIYAADEVSPNAILSAFNLRTTVLDIPRLGSQTELYERQVTPAGLCFEKDEPLTFILEPEKRDSSSPRVMDLRMVVTADTAPGVAQFDLYDASSNRLAGPVDATALTDKLKALCGTDRDLYLQFEISGKATLQQVLQGAELIRTLLHQKILRPEPPVEGSLYYSAFLPNPALRQRELHILNPWEYRLPNAESAGLARLTRILRSDSGDGTALFEEESFEVHDSAEVLRIFSKLGNGLPALLVIAPPSLPYEVLRSHIGPLLPAHPNIFVFLE